jgi:hypothetical protein
MKSLLLVTLMPLLCFAIQPDSLVKRVSDYKWIEMLAPGQPGLPGWTLSFPLNQMLFRPETAPIIGIIKCFNEFGVYPQLSIGKISYVLSVIGEFPDGRSYHTSARSRLRYGMLEFHKPVIQTTPFQFILFAGGGAGYTSHKARNDLRLESGDRLSQGFGLVASGGVQTKIYKLVCDYRYNYLVPFRVTEKTISVGYQGSSMSWGIVGPGLYLFSLFMLASSGF